MTISTEETTFTAPVGQGQDAANAAGQGIASPDTASALAAARAAHAAAVTNHAAASERADRAAGQHRQAEADYRNLIADAASGSEISAADITRAKVRVSEMQDVADHGRLVMAGALALCERAAIAVMGAESERFQEAHAAALMAQIEAAERIDSAFASLQAEIDTHDAARIDVMTAANSCRMHGQAIIEAAKTNATLAKLESSARPRIKLADMPSAKPVRISFYETGFGETMIVKPYSVASALRAAWGIVAPKTGT